MDRCACMSREWQQTKRGAYTCVRLGVRWWGAAVRAGGNSDMHDGATEGRGDGAWQCEQQEVTQRVSML